MSHLEYRTYGFNGTSPADVARALRKGGGLRLKRDVSDHFGGEYFFWGWNPQEPTQVLVFRNQPPEDPESDSSYEQEYRDYGVLLNYSGPGQFMDSPLVDPRGLNGRLLHQLAYDDEKGLYLFKRGWNPKTEKVEEMELPKIIR
jgi:hypothetical protein